MFRGTTQSAAAISNDAIEVKVRTRASCSGVLGEGLRGIDEGRNNSLTARGKRPKLQLVTPIRGRALIKLYQFAPAFGLPNASPFCMKLETYVGFPSLCHFCSFTWHN